VNILINAMSARLGGGQTYVNKLVEHIPDGFEGTVYIISPDNLKFDHLDENVERLVVSRHVINNVLLRTFWEKLILPVILRKLEIDILFCPGGLLNTRCPSTCKQVVTFQNMLPFDKSQLSKYGISYAWLRNRLLRYKLLRSMQKADLVIFISRFARDFINRLSDAPISNSEIIPHGLDKRFTRREEIDLQDVNRESGDDYLLYVSSLDVYKSQCEVVEAYKLLKDSGRYECLPKLILAGHQFPHYTKVLKSLIQSLDLGEEVELMGFIEYDKLPALYQQAKINLFMSQTENCPFILLEAMASGTPLVVSDSPPMPEFGGDSVLYCDPVQPAEIADKIAQYLDDPELCRVYSLKAMEQSRRFDWEISARQTWDSIFHLQYQ